MYDMHRAQHGQHRSEPPAGVRGLEVSEILEILMVASQSDLFGLIPRSMEKVAREIFGLRPLGWAPKSPAVPIKLYWHASHDAGPAHAFLRAQLAEVAKAVVQRSSPEARSPRRH